MDLTATLAPSVSGLPTEPSPLLTRQRGTSAFPLYGEAGRLSTAQQATGGVQDPSENAARAKIEKTAGDFEASFLSVMVGQMFSGVETSAPFGGGQGEQMYKSFLTDAFSKSMSQHGGIGVSKAISAELLKLQGLSA